MSALRLSALCALLSSFAASCYGQAVNATLLGTVTDATGAVVAGAKVTITEVNTGVSHTGQTNESGNYTFPDLPPGQYSVTVEMAGFKTQTQPGISLLVNTSTRVDAKLEPGNITEHVEVSGTAELLETDRADTGRQIETVLLADSPLGVNRNFQTLLNLAPGTTPATFQHSQFFNASSSLQTEVNGQLRMGNNYQIEGIDDNERTGLLQILIPPIEAIQSVDVSTSNFDAELGRASGGVTNVILKSGTNDFHGAAYEFLQNSAMDARSFFNPSVGHIAYNYVGADIGGPIKKNKLFFFADYLRVMDHEANTNLATIPSAAFRTGDLSAAPTTIYNPFTGNPDGTGRVPFANNQIPQSMINPVSAKILGLLPGTNESFKQSSPSNNYFALLPFEKTTDSMDSKIDYNITDSDRLSGRFSFARPVIFQAPMFGSEGGGPAQGAFEGTGTQNTYSAGLNYDHVFSPTLLTEVRFGAAHYHNEALPSDYGKNDATNIGINGVNISPFTSGMVGININGGFSSPLVGYSASMPWIRAEANIDTVNTWTKISGNHTFKWGADLRRVRDDLLQDQTFSPRGYYTFSEPQTSIPGAKTGFGNDFASFLLDVPSQVGRDLNTYFPAYRAWQFFLFAADKWQVSSKLTIDLGLRWEFYPPATPEFPGGFSNYNPVNNSLVVAGVGGNASNLGMQTRYTYFAPRIGLAYRATDSTVIRAGFGTSYTPYPDNTYAYNFPVRANNSYQPSSSTFGPAVLGSGATATFQAGFPAPVPVAIPSNGIIPVGTKGTLASQQFFVIPLNYKNPYVEEWNVAVQQALPFHFVLDAAYVGNHGVDTSAQANLNASQTIGAGAKGQPEYPRTANTYQYFQGFSSMYNALQVKLDRRFSNGLLVTTAFTWSKGMDFQGDDDGGLIYYIDPRRNYARTDFDREFTFVQSYVYQLPFGSGKRWLTSGLASAVLGGWQTSAILSIYSGLPVNLAYSSAGLNAPGEGQSPNQIGPVTYPMGINIGNPWFSQSSFAAPAALTFGNVGRNSITGPGMFGLNLSLFKTFQLTERFSLELRGESFNFTNTPQFNNPGNTLGSSNFGYVTSTLSSGTGVNGVGGGRAIQLGVKLMF